MEEIDGILFAFVVANICNHHPALSLEEFMVFDIGRHIFRYSATKSGMTRRNEQ